ncbi:MAG: hypothetical protein GF315_14890, partial [candidate division Zixibacteria bacterium]|nr:hypothetical protein [candidate division Zixibacteria bacterium]
MKRIYALTVIFILIPTAITAAAPGDTLWTRTYGGSDKDAAYSLQQTSDGGFVLAGFTKSYGLTDAQFFVIKTDALGDSLWTQTYGESNDDFASAIRQTNDGGYIIVGTSKVSDSLSDDFYLVRTDSSGDTLWTRTFGGDDSEFGYSVEQTSDDGFILAGKTWSYG